MGKWKCRMLPDTNRATLQMKGPSNTAALTVGHGGQINDCLDQEFVYNWTARISKTPTKN